ncbi:FecR family protein [Sphingobacterium nematocida]|uniref:FecR family protein n=1 Tax=Sphingobacterium nematocida TaxID=1513896 RepID=A0A1T5BQZ5_9SPHI|nr:FecR domain-containing protein [Sphingobacterium nematocida]SKB49373.1 FecR family protein [Sphingobacterium nematocida]
MESQKLIELIEKYEIGTITIEELSILENYYSSLNEGGHLNVDYKRKAQIRLLIEESLNTSSIRSYPYWTYAVAACLLVFLSLGALLFKFNLSSSWSDDVVTLSSDATDLVQQYTTNKENRIVVLPDGTKVTLNAGSQLIYDKEYGQNNRTVRLVGEGYFDVKRDTLHPFVIEGVSYNIRVLGTTFNLKNYVGEISETSLISGSLEILDKKTHKRQALLKPLQKFVMDKNQLLAHSKVENMVPVVEASNTIIGEVAWIENRLVFQNAKVETILKDLERAFDVKFEVRLTEILDHRFTATFEDDSLDNILESLKYVKNFKTKKEGNKIIIY